METQQLLGINVSSLGSNALSIVLIFILICIFGGIIWAIFWWRGNEKKWSAFRVRIWQRDGTGFMQEKTDQAAIFVDKKTNNKRFFLRKNKVGLSPDDVPFIPTSIGGRVVYLFQNGLKNFYFIRPDVDEGGVSLSVGEEDVNWAINSYEKDKKLFSADKLMQYLPFILLGIVSIVILVLFVYLFKKFDVIKDASLALSDAAKSLAAAKSGTMVIPA